MLTPITSLPSPSRRTWTLILLLLMGAGLAGCAEPEEEEAVGEEGVAEEEAVEEDETPGFGVVTALAGASAAALFMAKRRRA